MGNNNTLITTGVMNAAPIERSTSVLAGKLAEWFNPHVPFIVGAGFVLLSVVFVTLNRRHVMHVDQVGAAH
ncbi:hypothetical protein [Brevibacillus choshinensis]|uniref:hypothetical protein n=1 Tax=Brevibacillus choshinensis TaxID=54911 RepID=UPI00399CD860